MANKYILVPDDIYRGFLNQTSYSNNEDNIGLDFARQNVIKSRKNKKLNTSARNLLYNQELSRYLKMRKEAKNRPIKVELSNGAKLLKLPSNAVVIDSENEDETEIDKSLIPNHFFSPSQLSELNKSNRNKSLASEKEAEHTSPTGTKTKKTLVSEKENERLPIDSITLAKVNKIEQTILQNPGKYGVTRLGRVLDRNKQGIPGSDLRESLLRIVGNPDTTFSPKGTNNLRKSVFKDPELVKIMQEKITIPRKTANSIKAANLNNQIEEWRAD